MKFARLGTPGNEIPVLVEGDRYLDELTHQIQGTDDPYVRGA